VAEVQGAYDKRFEAVPMALAESLDGDDVGASAAVFVDGEPVADVWGGHVDAARTAAWERDTIANVFSTTKTMVALCALILADRGDLDLTAPVARYWPEFAAAGKEGVQVRHLLSHTAGLPEFDPPVPQRDLTDWQDVTARLAAQAPLWEPGTLAGYHSVTQGFGVGEVVRRVTGVSIADFFAAEVAGPLGADFHFTLSAEHDHRFAPGIAPPDSPDGDMIAAAPPDETAPDEPAPDEPAPDETAPDETAPPAEAAEAIRLSVTNTVAWRRAQIPSGSGYGNARSVAAIQSLLACGGAVNGVRLLSPRGCDRAREEQYRGVDQVLHASIRYGMGYGLFDHSIGWGGWGGSLVLIDPQARMTVAYVMNQMLESRGMGSDHRGLSIVMAAYEGLGG
jgi:CubicO group peptidase (beta-lactamase class C family)